MYEKIKVIEEAVLGNMHKFFAQGRNYYGVLFWKFTIMYL